MNRETTAMRRLTILTALVAVVLTACSPESTPGTTTGDRPPPVVVGSAFEVFDTCDDLLAWYVDHGVEIVGPWGLGGQVFYALDSVEMAMDDSAGGEDGAAVSAPTAESTSREFTESNNQVGGVDEIDSVKTDGNRIFTLLDDTLRVARVGDPGIDFTGTLRLDWWPQGLLLHEDTVVVIGQIWSESRGIAADARFAPQYATPITRIAQIDVSDDSNPRIVRTLDLDGTMISAREVDGSLRVAVNTNPLNFAWEYPEGGGLRAESAATEANQALIRNSTLDNWLPWSVLTESDGTRTEGRLLDCSTVMAPTEFSGLDTLSLLTFDLDEGIGRWNDAGVVASGATMYATADSTYLATQRWMNWAIMTEADIADEAEGFVTRIHKFDTADSTVPRYVASGEVSGFLLNQFSMDEYLGDLRVASTTSPNDWWVSDESESRVTVLRPNGQELEQIGMVDGLGLTERIFAVRFMGDTGYVVTFRQTDPLYVIDLRDPSAPAAVGELKIPGYSAYLHPVGEGRILGVGQDATEQGRVQGTQFSLFDVGNPASPERISTVTLDGGWSQAEGNHLAFTFVDGTALAPYERWAWEWIESEEKERSTFDTGVLTVRLEGDSLRLDGVLRAELDSEVVLEDETDWDRFDPWSMVPQRTIVIDGYVYTITNGGIAIHDFDSLDRITYERF